MSEPGRWSDSEEPSAQQAARLFALAASTPAAQVDLRGWDDVVRAASSRRDWRLVPAFGASLVAGALLVVALRPSPPAAPAKEAPVLVASANALWATQPSGVVRLEAGRLSVQRATSARVVLQTPHATIEASGARFLAEVTAGGTTLVVEEGEAVLRARDTTRQVRAGETLVWPPAPTIPAPLTTSTAPASTVCADPTVSRLDCLRAEAKGEGLTAQAALYELGVFEAKRGNRDDALAAWTASLSRFPDGVLHPEVRLALLVELVQARRFTEAAAVAQGFEAACADDPRVGDVRRLRESLAR